MGWKLAEEVAWARPIRPGPEWWTLLDIAQDARDQTRRGTPGVDTLMDRAKCSRATLFRRLKALEEAGLLNVVSRSAPGKRPVFEIPIIHTGLSVSETRTGLSVSETRTGLSVSETRTSEQVSIRHLTGLKNRETGLSVSETPPVIHPSLHPSDMSVAVVPPSVEGSQPDANGAAPRQPIEQLAWEAIHRSANA